MHLRDVLAARLRDQRQRVAYHQSGYVYEKQPSNQQFVGAKLVEKATSMLDRVKVMRIFDVAGLVEAVSEIAELCEDVAVIWPEGEEPRIVGPRTVADSEDESGTDDNVDIGDLESKEETHRPGSGDAGMLSAMNGKIGMLIIDTIATVFGPLMTKGQVQGTVSVS